MSRRPAPSSVNGRPPCPNRLAAVLATGAATRIGAANRPSPPTGNNWKGVPDDLKAMIVLSGIEDALRTAEQTFSNGFFTDDGPRALRLLCEALKTLSSLQLTDKNASQISVSWFQQVVEKLRAFLGRVRGWSRRQPDDHVALMCIELEDLLKEGIRSLPPPLDRRKDQQLL